MGLPMGVALGQAKWLLFSAVSASVAVGTVQLATNPDTATSLAASPTSGAKSHKGRAKDRVRGECGTTKHHASDAAPVQAWPCSIDFDQSSHALV
jgi:hypothetical protein